MNIFRLLQITISSLLYLFILWILRRLASR